MKIWPMFCKACGQGIDRGDKFCRNCGVPLPQEPIESAVAASASAATPGEAPVVAVASSTAELQRPLPIPKALLTEAASAAAVEEKPSAPVTVPVEATPNKATEPKAEAAVPAQPAPDNPAQSSETPAQTAPVQQSQPAELLFERGQEKTAPSSVVAAEPPSPVAVSSAELESADAAKPQAEPAAALVGLRLDRASEDTAQPDRAEHTGSRPVRLCPQCHRLIGEGDRFCECCGVRLDQPAPTLPSPADEHYGVPSFAGYATAIEKAPPEVHVSDPSGVDAIANLRIRKRRGLSVVEIIVAVILLAGAGVAVWMLRSSLPDKSAPVALNVGVTVSPARAKVPAGHGYDFAATVTGTDNYNVDWSIDEGDAGGRVVPRGAKADGGAVSSLAVYMAPKTPGTYHVTATSKADQGKSATAIITVTGK